MSETVSTRKSLGIEKRASAKKMFGIFSLKVTDERSGERVWRVTSSII